MADFKRIIQRTTNSERVETGVADLQPNEICIVEDGEELIYKDRNGEFISVSKDKYTVDTIEDLKKSKKYKIGDVVQVLGYYTKGDGDTHKRFATNTNDGSGVFSKNGIWWNIVPSKNISSKHFGLKGTGYPIDDETTTIQRYVDFCFKNKIQCIFDFDNVWISDTIYLRGDIKGISGKFEFPNVNKPAFYIDMSLRKIDGLYVDFYGGESINDTNRYMLLCDKIDRKEIIGLKQWRGYGVIKTVELSDIDLVKNDITKQEIIDGTYGNHFFSNTVEILNASGIKGIGLNISCVNGGNTGNFFPNIYMNRKDGNNNNEDSLVEMIKFQSTGGGQVFGQLNLEWFHFGGRGAIALNDSEMIINQLYFEGVNCKASSIGFINQFFKSNFMCKNIEFINCSTEQNTSVLAITQDGTASIENVHISGYAPLIDWKNKRVDCVYFKTGNKPFTQDLQGSVSIGNVYKRYELLLNADNVCCHQSNYFFSDYEGLNNNTNLGIIHPLKKLGNKFIVPFFFGKLKDDSSNFTQLNKQSFSSILRDYNLMVSEKGFTIPESGIYQITYKAPFNYGSTIKVNGFEQYITQGNGNSEKQEQSAVISVSKGQIITIENIGSEGILSPFSYGFVSIKKIF